MPVTRETIPLLITALSALGGQRGMGFGAGFGSAFAQSQQQQQQQAEEARLAEAEQRAAMERVMVAERGRQARAEHNLTAQAARDRDAGLRQAQSDIRAHARTMDQAMRMAEQAEQAYVAAGGKPGDAKRKLQIPRALIRQREMEPLVEGVDDYIKAQRDQGLDPFDPATLGAQSFSMPGGRTYGGIEGVRMRFRGAMPSPKPVKDAKTLGETWPHLYPEGHPLAGEAIEYDKDGYPDEASALRTLKLYADVTDPSREVMRARRDAWRAKVDRAVLSGSGLRPVRADIHKVDKDLVWEVEEGESRERVGKRISDAGQRLRSLGLMVGGSLQDGNVSAQEFQRASRALAVRPDAEVQLLSEVQARVNDPSENLAGVSLEEAVRRLRAAGAIVVDDTF